MPQKLSSYNEGEGRVGESAKESYNLKYLRKWKRIKVKVGAG